MLAAAEKRFEEERAKYTSLSLSAQRVEERMDMRLADYKQAEMHCDELNAEKMRLFQKLKEVEMDVDALQRKLANTAEQLEHSEELNAVARTQQEKTNLYITQLQNEHDMALHRVKQVDNELQGVQKELAQLKYKQDQEDKRLLEEQSGDVNTFRQNVGDLTRRLKRQMTHLAVPNKDLLRRVSAVHSTFPEEDRPKAEQVVEDIDGADPQPRHHVVSPLLNASVSSLHDWGDPSQHRFDGPGKAVEGVSYHSYAISGRSDADIIDSDLSMI